MAAQILDRTMTCFRIGDADGRYRIFDATGSTLYPGRWNTAESPLIYTSRYYSTALLEKLVRGNGRLPPDQHYVRITLPVGLSYEMFRPEALPGWDQARPDVSRSFGEAWCRERRSVVLIVPSVVARLDENVLINPAHPEFKQIEVDLHRPVYWDRRLFAA